MPKRTGVPVRGTCTKCGTVVETNAAAGNTQWRGRCPKEGCTAWVIAKRVPTDERPPEATAPTPRKSAGRAKRGTYGNGNEPGFAGGAQEPPEPEGELEPGGDDGAAGGGVGRGAGAGVPDAAGELEPPGAAEPELELSGFRRWVERGRARRGLRATAGRSSVVPGIY